MTATPSASAVAASLEVMALAMEQPALSQSAHVVTGNRLLLLQRAEPRPVRNADAARRLCSFSTTFCMPATRRRSSSTQAHQLTKTLLRSRFANAHQLSIRSIAAFDRAD